MNKDHCIITIRDSEAFIENPSEVISIRNASDFLKDKTLEIKVSASEKFMQINLVVNHTDNIPVNFKIKLELLEGSKLILLDESHYNNDSDLEFITIMKKNSCFELYKINRYQNHNTNKFLHDCTLLENCSFKDYSFSNGSKENISKTIVNLNDINASFLGSGISINDSTHTDNLLEIRHNSKSALSNCYFKTVAKGNSKVNFDGTIFVDNHCSKTTSNQVSKGLLIGDHSKINLVPKLEIYNDDVECSHGAASGQPDKNTLFYLTSRGISKKDAEEIYIEGFLSEFFDTIENLSMLSKAKNFISLNK